MNLKLIPQYILPRQVKIISQLRTSFSASCVINGRPDNIFFFGDYVISNNTFICIKGDTYIGNIVFNGHRNIIRGMFCNHNTVIHGDFDNFDVTGSFIRETLSVGSFSGTKQNNMPVGYSIWVPHSEQYVVRHRYENGRSVEITKFFDNNVEKTVYSGDEKKDVPYIEPSEEQVIKTLAHLTFQI